MRAEITQRNAMGMQDHAAGSQVAAWVSQEWTDSGPIPGLSLNFSLVSYSYPPPQAITNFPRNLCKHAWRPFEGGNEADKSRSEEAQKIPEQQACLLLVSAWIPLPVDRQILFVSCVFDAHARGLYFELKAIHYQEQQVRHSIPDRNLSPTKTNHTKMLIPLILLGNKKKNPHLPYLMRISWVL